MQAGKYLEPGAFPTQRGWRRVLPLLKGLPNVYGRYPVVCCCMQTSREKGHMVLPPTMPFVGQTEKGSTVKGHISFRTSLAVFFSDFFSLLSAVSFAEAGTAVLKSCVFIVSPHYAGHQLSETYSLRKRAVEDQGEGGERPEGKRSKPSTASAGQRCVMDLGPLSEG
jgi:hypothetical protein